MLQNSLCAASNMTTCAPCCRSHQHGSNINMNVLDQVPLVSNNCPSALNVYTVVTDMPLNDIRCMRRKGVIGASLLLHVNHAPNRVPPTTVASTVSTGEPFRVTGCTFTAALVALKIDSALSSMISAVAYLVGLAITVYSEPANDVTTPAPLAARVTAGPPTDVTILSATPPMARGYG